MKFTWKKVGQIFDASQFGNLSWAVDSALTPTPFRLDQNVIRVYAGFRDLHGVSRIGYVDIDADNPSHIINVSDAPSLDVGKDGCFDDNGVILGDVIKVDDYFYMYYVGFQLVEKVKFLAFSGLAKSKDAIYFERVKNTPILDRAENATFINAIHSVIKMDKGYRVWHAQGDGWEIINNSPYPKYNIWTSTSDDGITINNDSILCVDVQGCEYRIGRPSVYKIKETFVMFYTKGTSSGEDYYPGIATSVDGVRWERHDELFGLELSVSGWDSRHIAYPRLLQISDNKFYVFYNGNDMGKHGFGYAELLIEG